MLYDAHVFCLAMRFKVMKWPSSGDPQRHVQGTVRRNPEIQQDVAFRGNRDLGSTDHPYIVVHELETSYFDKCRVAAAWLVNEINQQDQPRVYTV